MVIITPPPCTCIAGITSRLIRAAETRFRSMISCHSSSEISGVGVHLLPPTLLINTSTRPYRSNVAFTNASASSPFVTSASWENTSAPSALTSSVAASRVSGVLPQMLNFAPSAAKPSAIAFPMPRLAPVTMTTLSLRFKSTSFSPIPILAIPI